jgi:hypothetical protein
MHDLLKGSSIAIAIAFASFSPSAPWTQCRRVCERAAWRRLCNRGRPVRRLEPRPLRDGPPKATIQAQNPEAGAEPLFGMRPAGEHGADQGLGVRPDLAGPAAEPIRRPLGVAPMRLGHALRVRAVLAAHVAALVDRDAQAAVECLDDSRGDPHIDLGANERVRTSFAAPARGVDERPGLRRKGQEPGSASVR